MMMVAESCQREGITFAAVVALEHRIRPRSVHLQLLLQSASEISGA